MKNPKGLIEELPFVTDHYWEYDSRGDWNLRRSSTNGIVGWLQETSDCGPRRWAVRVSGERQSQHYEIETAAITLAAGIRELRWRPRPPLDQWLVDSSRRLAREELVRKYGHLLEQVPGSDSATDLSRLPLPSGSHDFEWEQTSPNGICLRRKNGPNYGELVRLSAHAWLFKAPRVESRGPYQLVEAATELLLKIGLDATIPAEFKEPEEEKDPVPSPMEQALLREVRRNVPPVPPKGFKWEDQSGRMALVASIPLPLDEPCIEVAVGFCTKVDSAWVATRYDGLRLGEPCAFMFVAAYELIRVAHDLAKEMATPQMLPGCSGCSRECPLLSDDRCPSYLPTEIKYLGMTFVRAPRKP